MFVVTIDQESSRTRQDRVPDLLSQVTDALTLGGSAESGDAVLRPFERTVGDEVQGVLGEPAAVVTVCRAALRAGGWQIGIGCGEGTLPAGASARESRGPAFVRARAAVERAALRGAPVPLAIEGAHGARAAHAEALWQLWATVLGRRTSAGWEAVDAAERALRGGTHEGTNRAVARMLGISDQAASQRLRAAAWQQEHAALAALAEVLGEVDA